MGLSKDRFFYFLLTVGPRGDVVRVSSHPAPPSPLARRNFSDLDLAVPSHQIFSVFIVTWPFGDVVLHFSSMFTELLQGSKWRFGWDDFGLVAYVGDIVMISSNHPRAGGTPVTQIPSEGRASPTRTVSQQWGRGTLSG